MKAGQYAYRDRRQKKRQFRALWIARINAAVREVGMSYSVFMAGLKRQHRDRPQGAGRSRGDGQGRVRADREPGEGQPGTPKLQDLEVIVARALADFSAAATPPRWRTQGALPRQGELSGFRPQGSPEERRAAGAAFTAKQRIEAGLEARRGELADAKLSARLAEQAIDRRCPAAAAAAAGHPVIRTWQRIEEIWRSIGFDVADGPEIETDWFNFTALNSPENHPSR